MQTDMVFCLVLVAGVLVIALTGIIFVLQRKQNRPMTFEHKFLVSLPVRVDHDHDENHVNNKSSSSSSKPKQKTLSSSSYATGMSGLSLFERMTLYSDLVQPKQYTPVSFVVAQYQVIGFDPLTQHPICTVTATVEYPDRSSLQIQGLVTRDVQIDTNKKIIKNQLVRTNIAVIGGTGRFVGSYGSWTSRQVDDTTTEITTRFSVPFLAD